MGDAKRRQYSREQFLKDHPWCCYCGAAATTTDHCPPRAFFRNREWPEGYEFPCCGPCNAEGRLYEKVVAVVLKPSFLKHQTDDLWARSVQSIRVNEPALWAEWLSLNRREMRNRFRERFGAAGDKMRQSGYGMIAIGPLTQELLQSFAVKLGKALFFKHNGRRLEGKMWCRRFDPLSQDTDFAGLFSLTAEVATLQRGRADLSDQFSYAYNFSPDEGAFHAVITLGEQFGLTVIAADFPLAEQLTDPPADPDYVTPCA